MSDPKPVILAVKSPSMATEAIDSLQPEYEGAILILTGRRRYLIFYIVIHVISSTAAGACDIPALLRGEPVSPADPHNLGTQNYAKTAVAVVIGRMFDNASIADMRAACEGRSNVPWLRQDLSKPEPPMGHGYAEAITERIKASLSNLTVKEAFNQDGVYFY
jgi:hypothetical protein